MRILSYLVLSTITIDKLKLNTLLFKHVLTITIIMLWRQKVYSLLASLAF